MIRMPFRLELAPKVGVLLLLTSGVASAIAGWSTASAQNRDDPTLVMTRNGSLRGLIEDGLVVFKGIPYAAPPVGRLRWKPTQPALSWDGVLDATQFGTPCPSIDTSRFAEGRLEVVAGAAIFVDMPLAAGSGEDCLRLNIWAPEAAERAAVMVWIQPLGSSSLPVFDGAVFAREGVVFVTMDYRALTLGNFAHPALTADAEPNEWLSRYQTMDQMAALRWVKQNIEAFGGDPDNVTVFGQSAGAASTLQLLTIPDARGLVDKAIVQSGVGWWTPWTLSQMERVGVVLATHAGLPGEGASAEQLRALPIEALPQLGVYSIDGRMEPENGTTAIGEGRMADVPLMIGSTSLDGTSIDGDPVNIVARASEELMSAYESDGLTGADLGYQMYTDEHASAPARWIAREASAGAPSYLYLFSYVPAGIRSDVRGAAHGDDMWLLFDAWEFVNPRLRLTEEDRAAARMVRSCWVSFAKTGTPQCDGTPAWPRYTPEDDRLMDLGADPRVIRNFRKRQLDAQEDAWRTGADERQRWVEDGIRALELNQL